MSRPLLKSLRGVYLLVLTGWIAALVAVFQIGLPDAHLSIKNHHIQHVFFVLSGSFFGLALARSVELRRQGGAFTRQGRTRPGSGAWLLPALIAPAAVMIAMWPSSYPYIEARPLLHAAEHGVFIVLSGLAVFSGYMFSRSAGWLLGGMMVAMAWLAAFGFGVVPGPNPLLAENLMTQSASVPVTDAAVDGATVYQQCAACHQPGGTGLPGAFPPLAAHIPRILAGSGGRDYLVQVLLHGLQGPISAAGSTYNGTMPAWNHLSDAQLAAVLNYISTSWGDHLPAGQQPFTAAEVSQARSQQLTPQQVHEQREQLGLN